MSTLSQSIPLALGIQVSLPASGNLKIFHSHQAKLILPCTSLEEHTMLMKMGFTQFLTIKAFVEILLPYFVRFLKNNFKCPTSCL